MDGWFEMNLTQRRKERLRMTLCVLASLRLCVNFYAVFEALSKIGTTQRKKCQPLRERSVCMGGQTGPLLCKAIFDSMNRNLKETR